LLLVGAGFARADEQQAIPPWGAGHRPDRHAAAEQRGRSRPSWLPSRAQKGSQIAVLIVPTVKPETIEQYALRVAESWRLGRRGVDDGALLLVARGQEAFASKSATASRARSTMQPPSESSARSSARVSSREILPAALTPASTR
jgi:hypothetical protein